VADPQADDVAGAWNESIARLGLLSVFPPEEDFHVGDVWAVIAEVDTATPLLGRAVRLAHIDLRDAVEAARNQQPVFADTAALEPAIGFRRQPRTEVAKATAGDPITLTLTAFPGISIHHTRRRAGLLTRSVGGFGAVREELESEEIRIPVAETYGVSAAAGIGRLDAWCQAPETAFYCSDAFARRVLAFAVSDRVLAARDGRYVAKVQLQLVTRVFLTREIEHRRLRDASGSAVGRAGEAAKPADGPVAAGHAEAPAIAATDLALPDTPGATLRAARTDGSEITLRQVFQRPVIFGFRAVTTLLPPSAPPPREPPQ
jgi:hypothetical protein